MGYESSALSLPLSVVLCLCVRMCVQDVGVHMYICACSHGECGCTLDDLILPPPAQECLAYRYALSQLVFCCWWWGCWWCLVFVFVLGTKTRASCILDKHKFLDRTVIDKDQMLRPRSLWGTFHSHTTARSFVTSLA